MQWLLSSYDNMATQLHRLRAKHIREALCACAPYIPATGAPSSYTSSYLIMKCSMPEKITFVKIYMSHSVRMKALALGKHETPVDLSTNCPVVPLVTESRDPPSLPLAPTLARSWCRHNVFFFKYITRFNANKILHFNHTMCSDFSCGCYRKQRLSP